MNYLAAAPASGPIKEISAAAVLKGVGGTSTFADILPKVESFVFYLALAVCLIFTILAAFQYFFGEGDAKSNTETAKKSLTYAITAFVILLLMRFIFIAIASVFGITLDLSIFE